MTELSSCTIQSLMCGALLTSSCALMQILAGIDHLHWHGIQHGDLKSDNVLYKIDPHTGLPVFKIADIGCAAELNGQSALPT
jgi:serine/threonine protein kinase